MSECLFGTQKLMWITDGVAVGKGFQKHDIVMANIDGIVLGSMVCILQHDSLYSVLNFTQRFL